MQDMQIPAEAVIAELKGAISELAFQLALTRAQLAQVVQSQQEEQAGNFNDVGKTVPLYDVAEKAKAPKGG